MVNFYDISKIEIFKKKLKTYNLIFYFLLSLLILSEIIFCIILGYKNKNIIQPLMIVFSIIGAALLSIYYLYFVYPNKWIVARYKLMNNAFKHECIGVVESIKENVTLRKDIVGKEITFIIDNQKSILYLEDNDLDFVISINETYKISTYDNFIITLEKERN